MIAEQPPTGDIVSRNGHSPVANAVLAVERPAPILAHEDIAQLVDLAILPERDDETSAVDLLTLGINDDANAQAVSILYPEQFAFTESHGWIHYTGVHWNTETAEATVERAIVATLKARIQQAIDADPENNERLIKFCAPNSGRVTGAKHLLSSKLATSHSAFDASPDLLNCPNGVVDLRTGELLAHAPSYRFMHVAGVAYDPKADASAWVDWLTQAVGGEAEAQWVQRAVGYTLTGHTSEEVLFYLYGPPRSGKGIFCETLRRVMGDQLAKAIPFSVLIANADVDAQNFALAPLKPTRLVLAAESNQYERFNEAKLKAITGGDAISCAFKHRDAFNYRPQFRVWLSSNQPVYADPDDDAVWGRIRVIPFLQSYLGREDKTLKERMMANLAGVLAWAVAGAVAWRQSLPAGLPELPHLAALKDAQRSEVDHVAQWMDDRCQLAPEEFTSTRDLYASYADWCRDNGVQPKQLRGFTASLKSKHLPGRQQRMPGSANAVRGFMGLKL